MFATIWRFARWPALLVCLWMISIIGIKSIPLEDHEVFVLQTTREMEANGNWVLPSFNYEPRLQKPPLNYWATEAVSRLDPFSQDVQTWHGRAVSLLGSLIMVLATYFAGKRLFGSATGKLASLLLLSMQGYINLSHSARPDFLYSSLGVLSLFAWILAWKSEDDSWGQRGWSWSGWGLAGLATLTKGPQVPVLFLASLLIFLLSGPERRRTLKILRPGFGVALFAALVVPWWVLLQRQVGQLGLSLKDSQLSGSLLANLASWKEVLSGYYLWTLIGLMLPASLVLPVIMRWLRKRREPLGDTARLLIHVGIPFLVAFTLGGHYRKHYVLPLLPLFSLFIAHAVKIAAPAEGTGRWNRWLLALFAATAGVCGWLILRERAYGSLAWLLLNALPIWLLLRAELRGEEWREAPWMSRMAKASAAIAILTTGILAFVPMAVVRWRRAEQSFAESIGERLQGGDLIVQWQCSEPILPFYAKRPVPRFTDEAELGRYVLQNGSGHRIYAVLPNVSLPSFESRFTPRVLSTVKRDRHPEDDLTFVELTNPGKVSP